MHSPVKQCPREKPGHPYSSWGKVAALKSEQICPTGLVDTFYSKTKLYCILIIMLMTVAEFPTFHVRYEGSRAKPEFVDGKPVASQVVLEKRIGLHKPVHDGNERTLRFKQTFRQSVFDISWTSISL